MSTLNDRRGVACAVALSLVTSACNDPPPRAAPDRRRGAVDRSATGAPDARRALRRPDAAGARVVVDVSQSIRGFTAAGSVNLEKLHTAIDNALGDADAATPLHRCTLGDELSCDTPLTQPQFNNGALYSAGNCRLDRAIRVPPVVDPRNPPRDELDHHRVTVILTDGMQSAAAGGGGGNDAVAACNSGADPNCIRLLLRNRIRQGYGVWLTQIMLPFQGTHYAERGLDRATYDGIRAHVGDAALRLPYSRDPFPAAATGRHHASRRHDAAGTLFVGWEFRVDARNGLASFEYRGWKPMLAWVQRS